MSPRHSGHCLRVEEVEICSNTRQQTRVWDLQSERKIFLRSEKAAHKFFKKGNKIELCNPVAGATVAVEKPRDSPGLDTVQTRPFGGGGQKIGFRLKKKEKRKKKKKKKKGAARPDSSRRR